MAHNRITRLKRMVCFSTVLKNSIFIKLIIPSSFIAICILLFLNIQSFGDERSPVFLHKTGHTKLLDEVGRREVTLSDNELFKFRRDMMVTRGEYFKTSLNQIENKTVSKNNSFDTPIMNKSLEYFSRDEISAMINKAIHHSRQQTTAPVPTQKRNVVIYDQTRHNSVQNIKQNEGKSEGFDIKPKELPVFVVIVVISRPENVLLRQATRKTWARDAELYRILVRFVVGRQEDWNNIVDRESTMHKDLILFEEDDVEEVLPSKVIQGFEWALNLRPQPIYVMKIDDDTIVNLPFLTKELLKQSTVVPSQIVGAIREKVEVIRDHHNKWSVSMLDYPAATYPTYAFGGGYVMRAQTAHSLLEKRYYTYSWVHLEDVYLTGFVAAKAGVAHKYHRGFSSWEGDDVTACDFVQDRRLNSVNNTEKDMYDMYKGIQMLLRSGNEKYCD